jgi:hypothetical protein
MEPGKNERNVHFVAHFTVTSNLSSPSGLRVVLRVGFFTLSELPATSLFQQLPLA